MLATEAGTTREHFHKTLGKGAAAGTLDVTKPLELLKLFSSRMREDEGKEELRALKEDLMNLKEKACDIPTPLSSRPEVRKAVFGMRKAQTAFLQQFHRRLSELEKASAFKLLVLWEQQERGSEDAYKTFVRDIMYLEKQIELIHDPKERAIARMDWRKTFRAWVVLHLLQDEKVIVHFDKSRNAMEFYESSSSMDKMPLVYAAIFPAYHALIPNAAPEIPAPDDSAKWFHDRLPVAIERSAIWISSSFRSVKDQETSVVLHAVFRFALGAIGKQLALSPTEFAAALSDVASRAVHEVFWRTPGPKRYIAPHAVPQVESHINALGLPTTSIYSRGPDSTPLSLHHGTYAWPVPGAPGVSIDPKACHIIMSHIMLRREDGSIASLPFRSRSRGLHATDADDNEDLYKGGSPDDRRFVYSAIAVSFTVPVENRTLFGDFLPGVPKTENVVFKKLLTVEIDLPRDVFLPRKELDSAKGSGALQRALYPDGAEVLKDRADILAPPFNARVTGIYATNEPTALMNSARSLLRASLS
ncbi:Hypothetical Protein FCC1311_036102 [Hondaea fermentalgiana]|uniref:Uncharacterized protein n=1 Tax=Hondaea fermentalgiana TaxID=2315210 RepID=A0A2R5GCE7_9STRA|nr:Hypothetical Protein FCC1311_036102 [Hondaea fermentalgiana]|eukprot:GBG27388.1 Hypothetical Protein FCC1311_036102 [Hondaea fermentalgiana]